MKLREELFPSMVNVVPPATQGIAAVEHFTVNKIQSQMTAWHGMRSYVEPGKYASLKVRGSLMMSDTNYERRSNTVIAQQATGRVLLAGYGLGMTLIPILKKPDVTEVVVVEKEPDVVALVDPYIRRHVGEKAAKKLTVHEADIYTAKPLLLGQKFDALWFDIWGDCSTDTLDDMTRLTRMYRSLKRSRLSFMECWDREWLRYRKRNGY